MLSGAFQNRFEDHSVCFEGTCLLITFVLNLLTPAFPTRGCAVHRGNRKVPDRPTGLGRSNTSAAPSPTGPPSDITGPDYILSFTERVKFTLMLYLHQKHVKSINRCKWMRIKQTFYRAARMTPKRPIRLINPTPSGESQSALSWSARHRWRPNIGQSNWLLLYGGRRKW